VEPLRFTIIHYRCEYSWRDGRRVSLPPLVARNDVARAKGYTFCLVSLYTP